MPSAFPTSIEFGQFNALDIKSKFAKMIILISRILSPGLVVMGGDSCSKRREFES